MFSHVFIASNDVPAAVAFYAQVLGVLALPLKMQDDARPWAVWASEGGQRPFVIVGRPHDGQPAAAGNGQMVAFLAADRPTVDAAYAAAIKAGARCAGPPGLRPEYHPSYYGAYVWDLDGNKLCVCCHQPQ